METGISYPKEYHEPRPSRSLGAASQLQDLTAHRFPISSRRGNRKVSSHVMGSVTQQSKAAKCSVSPAEDRNALLLY